MIGVDHANQGLMVFEKVGEFHRVIFVRFLVLFADEQIGAFIRKRTSESVAPGFFVIHQD
jgi:hypothetical protein